MSLRSILLLSVTLVLVPSSGLTAAATAPSVGPHGLLVVPLAVDAVRRPLPVDARVLIYNPDPAGGRITLTGLSVYGGGVSLVERRLAVVLEGDARFGELAAIVERLPPEIAGHHAQRQFAPEAAPQWSPHEVPERLTEIESRLSELRALLATEDESAWIEVPVRLPLDRLAAGAGAGETELRFEVTYRAGDGKGRRAVATHAIRRLPEWPELPAELDRDLGALTLHAGDLHVHSCHGEALNACAPSDDCAAESLQLFGSFTYAELESQYRALGLDWFTATDHSYCINDDAEYAAIAAEVAELTTSEFIAYPDTELSSDEEGPQSGIDLGDLLCLGLTEANHMGAHGIRSRKPGGNDDLLGFCDGLFSDVLDEFTDNIAAIRAEGGYAVANHPSAESWGWNSFEATGGIESGGLQGVEIWTGRTQSGQDGHVGQWVDWLLAGRILYAYSGSDTHDAAFDFGANHVILTEPFTPQNLKAATMGGRLFLSNGPLLALAARVDGEIALMGDIVPVTASGGPVELRAYYSFGETPTTITLFRGAVGDAAELSLCTSAPLTDSGFFACSDTLVDGARSYYRAYAEDGAAERTAYTNPVFFEPIVEGSTLE